MAALRFIGPELICIGVKIYFVIVKTHSSLLARYCREFSKVFKISAVCPSQCFFRRCFEDYNLILMARQIELQFQV